MTLTMLAQSVLSAYVIVVEELLAVFYRKNMKQNRKNTDNFFFQLDALTKFSLHTHTQPPPAAYDELIKYITETLSKGLDRKNLVLGTELGKGEFGAVNEGQWVCVRAGVFAVWN